MIREYKNSGFAGEMLVAAELSRLGFQVMLGNVGAHKTERYDLAAACPVTDNIVGVSVKSLKAPNVFLIDPERLMPETVYVFVITGKAGALPKFFVVRGQELLADERRFWGKWGREYKFASRRGIGHGVLSTYENNWAAIERLSTSRRVRPKGDSSGPKDRVGGSARE